MLAYCIGAPGPANSAPAGCHRRMMVTPHPEFNPPEASEIAMFRPTNPDNLLKINVVSDQSAGFNGFAQFFKLLNLSRLLFRAGAEGVEHHKDVKNED